MSDAYLHNFQSTNGYFETKAYSKLIKYKNLQEETIQNNVFHGISKLSNSKGILMFVNNHFFDLYLREELKFQIWDCIFLKIPGFPGFPEAF